MEQSVYENLIKLALREDLNTTGDITSDAIFSDEEGIARLVSKDTGILAGFEIIESVFAIVDDSTKVISMKKEGDPLLKGDIVAEISGKVRSILTAERTAVNFLSYTSGIATQAHRFVKALEGHGRAVILDTRKTLPGYRQLAKYAVVIGGGQNHRMGLYDMVMIKDNHIDAAGSITKAVDKVRQKYGDSYKIEVECRTLEEVREAAGLVIDVVMLDNMDTGTAAEAVKLVNGQVLLEVSGNMDLEKVADYSDTGVDYISVGSLTHSVKAFDFSLKWCK